MFSVHYSSFLKCKFLIIRAGLSSGQPMTQMTDIILTHSTSHIPHEKVNHHHKYGKSHEREH